MLSLSERVEDMGLRELLIVEDRLRRLSDVIRPANKTIEELRQHVHKTINLKIKENIESPGDLELLLIGLLKP